MQKSAVRCLPFSPQQGKANKHTQAPTRKNKQQLKHSDLNKVMANLVDTNFALMIVL